MEEYFFSKKDRQSAKFLINEAFNALDPFSKEGTNVEAIKFYSNIIEQLNSIHGNRCNGRTAYLRSSVKDLFRADNKKTDVRKQLVIQDLTVLESIFNSKRSPNL